MTQNLSDNDVIVTAISPEKLTRYNPDNFLQQGFWGQHKAAFGWRTHYVRIARPTDQDGYIDMLVLQRRIGFGFSFLYIPHAPDRVAVEALFPRLDLGLALHKTAQQIVGFIGERILFTRFDLAWAIEKRPFLSDEQPNSPFDGQKIRQNLKLSALSRTAADVQPPDTVLLDLRPGEAAILAGMRAKTRYNIRLAEKKGVRIVAASLDQLDTWYGLYQVTAERDQIAIHSRDYYHRLMELNPESVKLFFAYHEADLLAGVILIFAGKTATYLYGASNNLKRNLMPAYALQWHGIKMAISANCTVYDFGGVPSSDDPHHPMHGLFQFKTGFGGDLVAFPGAWDSPQSLLMYRLFRVLEKIRTYYFKKIKKR